MLSVAKQVLTNFGTQALLYTKSHMSCVVSITRVLQTDSTAVQPTTTTGLDCCLAHAQLLLAVCATLCAAAAP